MASGSFSSTNRAPLFQTSVDKLLNNWDALQIAVENGQGGAFGKDIALWMRKAVEDFFYENDDLMEDEVAEFLATIMDQELDTVVDDNSLDELGRHLCHHFRLAMDRREVEIMELHKSLDAAAATAKPKAQAQTGPDDSDSNDSDEEMETDETPPTNGTTGGNDSSSAGPSSHRTGHNFVTEPDDDGWVTVVKPKKH